MPFTTGDPLGAEPWCIIYLVITFGAGLLKSLTGKNEDCQAEDTPYAGHHYQRRQAKNMLK